MAATSAARARVARGSRGIPSRGAKARPSSSKRGNGTVSSARRMPRRITQSRIVELRIAARAQLTRRNLVAGTLLALVGFVNVYAGLWVSGLSYELTHAHEVQGRLERDLQDLRVDLAAATASGRLEKLAVERLGMKPPSAGQVVILK